MAKESLTVSRGLAVLVSVLLAPVVMAAAAIEEPGSPVSSEQTPQNSNAAFEIYCDFRCPFCARLFITLRAGATAASKQPNIRFRDYPFHRGALPLSQYYESVVLNYPEEADDVIESLYRFQRQTAPDADVDSFLAALSRVHGMDFSLLKRDMQARDVELTIAQSEREAAVHDVRSTPTVFSSGSSVPDLSPEALANFILERSPLKQEVLRPAAANDCQSCQRPGK